MTKKLIFFSLLIVPIIFLSGCSKEQEQTKKDVQSSGQTKPVKEKEDATITPKDTQFSGSSETQKTASYENKNYGIKISFPPEIKNIEYKEQPLKDYHADNPLFSIQFGKNKDDFFESEGEEHGNMLSVWIYDRTKCDAPNLDSNEKEFCEEHRMDNAKGKFVEEKSTNAGIWFGNQKYLYQLKDIAAEQTKGLAGKIKVELSVD